MGAADVVGASSEVISKILVAVILGMLVYRTRRMLSGHVGIMAEAVVDPATYRGIFMHTIATLRSVGIEADDRIRGVLVTAYQSFVTNAGGIQPVKADLEKAAEAAAKDAVAAVPVVPRSLRPVTAADVASGAAGANPLGTAVPRLSPAEAAALGAKMADAAAGAGSGGDGAAPPAPAAAARPKVGEVRPRDEGAEDTESEDEIDSAGAAAPASKRKKTGEGKGDEFADVSLDSSAASSAASSQAPGDEGAMEGGRRCRSCGNVFRKTRRAARGKKSKKSGKTAKKGGKKAVRKGSFRKGRKHSKKQRR